jgi:hypothetical protein
MKMLAVLLAGGAIAGRTVAWPSGDVERAFHDVEGEPT